MTKLEHIQKAYGEHWEKAKNHVSENGYIEFKVIAHGVTNELHYEDDFNYTDIQVDVIQDYGHGQFLWRPKELRGIEYNNEWIRLEDDGSNIPTEECLYDLCHINIDDGFLRDEPLLILKRLFESKLITHYKKSVILKHPLY